jgi:6-pyruvoyl-tetrahydropterin synthase related domain
MKQSLLERLGAIFPYQSSSSIVVFYLVALIATALVAPMCFLGNASGHDFQPHIASWIEAANQWREGIILPRWAAGANYNFGEPRFIFYPPLSWIMGAALGSILPWKIAPGIYVWICVVIAGMAMWFFARQHLSRRRAIAAGLCFAANPYHFALIYYRSAYAELLVSAFFPLIVAGAFGVWRGKWSQVVLLAFSFAAIWLTNAPAAVITTYSLALLLVVGSIVYRSVRPLWFGSVAMLAGFGLAAFYTLPAWWEQPWIQISGAISTTYNAEHNFLFTRANDPDFIQFNWKISAIAVVLITLTTSAVACSRKLRRERQQLWWAVVVLAIFSVFLMLPLSAFIWRRLPELLYLQFPWRWLLVLGFAFAFLTGAARRRAAVLWLTVGVVTAATGFAIAGDTYWDSEDVQEVVESVRSGRGYEGIEGFQPRHANLDELDEDSPLIGEVDLESGDVEEPENVKINVQRWSPEDKVFETKSDDPVKIALKLFDYPAWEIRVDGHHVPAETVSQTGQIAVQLSAGAHHVELHFRRTRDRMLGEAISIFSLICLVFPATVVIGRRFRSH